VRTSTRGTVPGPFCGQRGRVPRSSNPLFAWLATCQMVCRLLGHFAHVEPTLNDRFVPTRSAPVLQCRSVWSVCRFKRSARSRNRFKLLYVLIAGSRGSSAPWFSWSVQIVFCRLANFHGQSKIHAEPRFLLASIMFAAHSPLGVMLRAFRCLLRDHARRNHFPIEDQSVQRHPAGVAAVESDVPERFDGVTFFSRQHSIYMHF